MTQLLISEQKSHEVKMDSIDTLFTDFEWRCYDIRKTHLNDLSFSWHKHILLLLIVIAAIYIYFIADMYEQILL